ncbi:hypothetical protein ACFCYN_04580 [Gottfriedia sp. NPDC056225]
MRFKHRYTFNKGNKKLEEFLTLNEIPFDLEYGIGVLKFLKIMNFGKK